MRIKKILANNYMEALNRVKEEMGEDAFVLGTRSIKYDPQGDGDRNSYLVEITAALEPEQNTNGPLPKTFESVRRPSEQLDASGELHELRTLIYGLLTQTEKAKAMELKPQQIPVFQKLVKRGVDEKLAAVAFRRLNAGSATGTVDVDQLEKSLSDLIGRVIRCDGPIRLNGKGPKLVALVGPTGAGKTTTLAKLAAHFALERQRRVALVSLDTYRIGAQEQLEIYGNLMGLPVESAASRSDLGHILSRHADKDLILIDTMGRNPRDPGYGRELAEIFRAAPQVETHLVHSLTTRESVIRESLKQFKPVGVDRLLLTKLDETEDYGSLLNFAIRYRIPFSYFTTGQSVPEDIETAVRDRVIRLIFN